MSFKYSSTGNEDENWTSFKQYTGKEDKHNSYRWTQQNISTLINNMFNNQVNENTGNNTTGNVNSTFELGNVTSYNANKNTQLNVDNEIEPDNSNITPVTNVPYFNEFTHGYSRTFAKDLFQTRSSKEYWEKLSARALKKKSPKKIVLEWQQSYINVLPLHTNSPEKNQESFATKSTLNGDVQSWSRSSSSDRCSLTSEESDSDFQSEDQMRKDPIYSRFGEIRDSFHTSEDGVVFNTQKELEIYKTKMAGMKEVFHFELELIKYQHDKLLQAKRAEERKLLKMNSHDIHEEEPTEKDSLNTENSKHIPNNKQERKSALFSSITDAFSYARTGIQGMFVKNSPNGSRKMRTQNEYSDSSDDEEEKLGSSLLSKNPDSLVDNHDEFTRKMATEGGLTYKSSDKTDQQLSYQNLPPPLSLTSLQAKAKT